MQINQENWTTSRFNEGELLAFISFGAKLNENLLVEDVYSVIVSNMDYQELSEQCFQSLNEAVESINNRFSHWKLTSLVKKDEGGCSTCAAH
jgi:hypothetical protein